jgi:hypothetical protein
VCGGEWWWVECGGKRGGGWCSNIKITFVLILVERGGVWRGVVVGGGGDAGGGSGGVG